MKSALIGIVLIGTSGLALEARADGGYYNGVLGARAAGRAGAFAARADDLTAVHYNPAGLTELESTQIMVGNRFSYNPYSYTRADTLDWGHPNNGVAPTVSFGKVSSSTPSQFLEPMFGVASKLGLRDWGFAFAVFAPPGVANEEFPVDGGQRYQMIKREAIILNYAASAAWKPSEKFGFGATLEWISVPRLVYSLIIEGTPFAGAANPVSSDLDILATTSGADYFTMNAILGGWFRPTPSWQFALAGQVIPTSIATHSTLDAKLLDQSFGTLRLSRDGVTANDVTVRLPLPLLARAGVRYVHHTGVREVFDLELDVEYETWSRVDRFSVETNSLVADVPGATVNLGRIDIAKNWRDTVAVRLGGDFAVLPGRLTLRAGASYVSAVADPAYANVDFPGAERMNGSLGASIYARQWELALAYQFFYQPNVTVTESGARVYQQVPASACQAPYTDTTTCNEHYLGQPSPAINAGTYSASSQILSLAAIYHFGS
jgi:long-chain fatty acid transport protein